MSAISWVPACRACSSPRELPWAAGNEPRAPRRPRRASTGSIAAQTTSDEQELRRLEDNWCLALKTRHEALLSEILAEDYVEVTSSGKRLVFTDTYVRLGGRWQCVAGQSTAMIGPKKG